MFQSLGLRLWAWLSSPAGFLFLSWLFSSVLGSISKPRTPEAYAALASRYPTWFFRRWASFTRFACAYGADFRKLGPSFARIFTGKVTPVEEIKRGLMLLASGDAVASAADAATSTETAHADHLAHDPTHDHDTTTLDEHADNHDHGDLAHHDP